MKHLNSAVFFLIFLVARTFAINVTVEDFRTILSPQQFERLRQSHKTPELLEQYEKRYTIKPASQENPVTLKTWQSYKKAHGEEWINQLRSEGHDLSNCPLLCIFRKSGLLYAYHIHSAEIEIANNQTHSTSKLAESIKGRADNWNDSSTDDYIDDLSHGIMITNRLLDAAKDIQQIMNDNPDSTLLLILRSIEEKASLDNTIIGDRYPSERVKTFIHPFKRKVVDHSIDFTRQTYQATYLNHPFPLRITSTEFNL